MGWSPLIALIAAVIMPPPVAQVVPMGREPLHHLRDANAIAAVYDVTVPPGAVMRWHAHPTAHLAVPIVMAKLRNEVVGSSVVEHLTPPGTLVFLDAGPVHRQSNIDDHAAEFIAVEFLKPTGATPPPLPPVYALALDNEVTQVLRLPLGAGARAEWPGFNRPVLLLSVNGGRFEIGGAVWVMPAGGTRWIAPGSGASIINRSRSDAALMVIAPK